MKTIKVFRFFAVVWFALGAWDALGGSRVEMLISFAISAVFFVGSEILVTTNKTNND